MKKKRTLIQFLVYGYSV